MLQGYERARGLTTCSRLSDDLTRRGGPAEQNVVDIALLTRRRRWSGIDAEAERRKQVSGIRLGGRRLPDGHVITETVRAGGAAGRDVCHEVAPESHHVVLVVAVAAELERHPDFRRAHIGGERGVCKGVVVVPDLNLADLAEVIAPIERHDLDVSLLEVTVRPRGPSEPQLVSRPRGADDTVARKRIAPRPVEILSQPVRPIGRGRRGRIVGPARNPDLTPKVRVRSFR